MGVHQFKVDRYPYPGSPEPGQVYFHGERAGLVTRITAIPGMILGGPAFYMVVVEYDEEPGPDDGDEPQPIIVQA